MYTLGNRIRVVNNQERFNWVCIGKRYKLKAKEDSGRTAKNILWGRTDHASSLGSRPDSLMCSQPVFLLRKLGAGYQFSETKYSTAWKARFTWELNKIPETCGVT